MQKWRKSCAEMGINMDKVKIGIIGCGMIADTYHLPALVRCEGAELVTACDACMERSEEIGVKYGFLNFTDKYEDILNNPEIEAVFILTKVSTHKTIAEAAARAGKHIFMQKPIAETREDAEGLIRLAEEYGVKLTVSFMHRYFDECVEAREILKSGMVGRIEQVHISNLTQNPPETAALYGGCILDIGSHGIDLASALFGTRIRSVLVLDMAGNESNGQNGMMGRECCAMLSYLLEDGTHVLHEINWSSASNVFRFQVRIIGKEAGIYIREPAQQSELAVARLGKDGKVFWDYPQMEQSFLGVRQHQLFIDDLRYGRNESLTGEDGCYVLKVIEAIRKSAQSGSREQIL